MLRQRQLLDHLRSDVVTSFGDEVVATVYDGMLALDLPVATIEQKDLTLLLIQIAQHSSK